MEAGATSAVHFSARRRWVVTWPVVMLSVMHHGGKRCSLWPAHCAEGESHCPWCSAVYAESASLTPLPKNQALLPGQSQPSWWVCWVGWCQLPSPWCPSTQQQRQKHQLPQTGRTSSALYWHWMTGVSSEGTGEIKEHDSHSATLSVQVSIFTVKQEDDGVVHLHLWLVGKVKGVQWWINQEVPLGRQCQDPRPCLGGVYTALSSPALLWRLVRWTLKFWWGELVVGGWRTGMVLMKEEEERQQDRVVVLGAWLKSCPPMSNVSPGFTVHKVLEAQSLKVGRVAARVTWLNFPDIAMTALGCCVCSLALRWQREESETFIIISLMLFLHALSSQLKLKSPIRSHKKTVCSLWCTTVERFLCLYNSVLAGL